MKRKDIVFCNCTRYAITYGKSVEKMFDILFEDINNYKNGFIRYVWKNINEYAKTDEKYQNAMKVVRMSRKKYGKIVKWSELDDDVKEAYKYLSSIYSKVKSKDKPINMAIYRQNYMKIAPRYHNIYSDDSAKSYALDDAINSFDTIFLASVNCPKDNNLTVGRTVKTKDVSTLNSVRTKPMFSKNNNKNSGFLRIEKDDKGQYILKCMDYTVSGLQHILDKYDAEKDVFTTNSGRCPNHKWKNLKIKYSNTNLLQAQIDDDSIYKGQLKITRVFKGNRWQYYLEINFENISPVVRMIQFGNVKLAVNFQTETVAIVDMLGNQCLMELSNSPRTIERIIELDRYMSNSRRTTNHKWYNKDGTIKSRGEMLEQYGITTFKESNGYKKAKTERKKLYSKLTARRKIDSYLIAKSIVEMCNEIIMDNNSYKAWGTKHSGMSNKSKQVYFSNQRVKDYTKQIHDRAPRYCRRKN